MAGAAPVRASMGAQYESSQRGRHCTCHSSPLHFPVAKIPWTGQSHKVLPLPPGHLLSALMIFSPLSSLRVRLEPKDEFLPSSPLVL